MTDRELEGRLRSWYVAEVGETESAPDDLRESLATIPATTPVPLRSPSRRRGFTLLAVAAILIVGGALAAGSGIVSPRPVVTPRPNVAVVPTTSPASETPIPTPNLRAGESIAYVRTVEKARDCLGSRSTCPTSRVWIVGSDGQGAHELFPDGLTFQGDLAWTPDGTRLLYSDDGKYYLTDSNGSDPQPVDTGCTAPCVRDSQITFSNDGGSIVFLRESNDADGYAGPTIIATMDLATGRVVELRSTGWEGTSAPGWSPDGKQILFFRFGEGDSNGPVAPRLSAVWLVDADGQNLRQVSPTTLAAEYPEWSPDGARILFESPDGDQRDLYTVRPDGTDARRLTTDGLSASASWVADGRILFARGSGAPGTGGPVGWWTMDADGTNGASLVSNDVVGASETDFRWNRPMWQPLGGAAIVPPPWTPATGVAVGPPAPTPQPTPTPSLSPGFAWTGSTTTSLGDQFAQSATLLADGRVLMAGGCGTAAEVYDPATGVFTPTGSMAESRGASTASLLSDGRVLLAGGYNCAAAGQDGMWASAELYDPATGEFSPTGSMATPRSQHTATVLADGRVLITGGLSGSIPPTAGEITLISYRTAAVDSFLATAEIYDPATGTFSRTGSMSTPHRGHTATLFRDGRVLVVGNGGESSAAGTAADVYDPTTGTWSRTGSMKFGRWLHTATLLADGRLLILGGRTAKDSVRASAELYDPATGRFTSAGSMVDGRQQHTATLLADGRVFIAGGYWSDGQKWRVLSATEMYNPATGSFSAVGSMGAPRESHSATLLDDGRVLLVGGQDIGNSGGAGVTSAVLYQP